MSKPPTEPPETAAVPPAAAGAPEPPPKTRGGSRAPARRPRRVSPASAPADPAADPPAADRNEAPPVAHTPPPPDPAPAPPPAHEPAAPAAEPAAERAAPSPAPTSSDKSDTSDKSDSPDSSDRSDPPDSPSSRSPAEGADPNQRRFGRVRGGPIKRGRRRRDRDRDRNRHDPAHDASGGGAGRPAPDAPSPDEAPAGVAAAPEREPSRKGPQFTGPKVPWQGMLELTPKGYGFLRRADEHFAANRDDIFVPPELIRRHGLRVGSMIDGLYQEGPRGPQLVEIATIDGLAPDAAARLPFFEELRAINPTRRVSFETVQDRFTTRVIDLMSPVARGQRGLIVSPPRSGKTTMLLHIAEAVHQNYEDTLHLMILLVDERPEEVTEFRRALPGVEIFASSNDEHARDHTRIAELAIERAKRLVEAGKDVFLLLDSITRLARAYNNQMRNKGRGTGSGGITVGALEMPRRLFAAARNTRGGGSLTILGTALVQTNSRADEAIFQEFKGTGNMELVLDRKIAESYIYPAVDIFKSGTRREELILPEHVLHKIHLIRRGLAGHRPVEAMERLLFFLKKFPHNPQMLLEIKG